MSDLNQDGLPEIILATDGDHGVSDSGHLMILSASGTVLHDVSPPDPAFDGNDNDAPAAPTVGDVEGVTAGSRSWCRPLTTE